jgi:tetratricopeptide (TPR) repeat protein
MAAAELASHWDGAGEPTRALPARVAAGLAAEHARAFAEADRHYQRALELWEQVTDPVRLAGLDRVDLLARAAEAAAQTGTTDRAIGLLERALDRLDPIIEPVRAATLLRRLGGHRHTALDHGAALAAYAEAKRLLAAAAPSAEQAAVLADYGHELEAIGRPQEAIPLLEESITVARLVGARAEEAFALASLACCLDGPDEVERSITLHLEARGLAEEIGDAEILIDTYVTLGATFELAGRGQDALVDAREGYQRACQLGLEHAVGSYVASHLAWQLLAAGRWGECERLTAEVLAIDSWDAYELHTIQGQLLARRGDFAAAHEQLDQARRTTPAANRDPAWAERAELALWEGNDQAVSAAIAEGLRWRTEMEPSRALSQYTSPLYGLALRLAADQAERAAARRATDELAQIQGQAASITVELDRLISLEVPMARHPGVRCNLLLAQAERSRLKGASDPERWQQAAAAWERLERPFEAAYAHFRQAEALLAGGAARDQAEAALRPAHHTAVSLGAGPLQGEIERLAQRGRPASRNRSTKRRCRGRPRRPPPSASPSVRPRCSPWSPRAGPTGRSARRCSSPPRPPASTSHGSWPNSASPAAARQPPSPTASASTSNDPILTCGLFLLAGPSDITSGESCSEHPEVLGHLVLNLAALPSAREVMRCTTAMQQRPASGKRAQWPANPLVGEP